MTVVVIRVLNRVRARVRDAADDVDVMTSFTLSRVDSSVLQAWKQHDYIRSCALASLPGMTFAGKLGGWGVVGNRTGGCYLVGRGVVGNIGLRRCQLVERGVVGDIGPSDVSWLDGARLVT